jgi:hypothetical protein
MLFQNNLLQQETSASDILDPTKMSITVNNTNRENAIVTILGYKSQ